MSAEPPAGAKPALRRRLCAQLFDSDDADEMAAAIDQADLRFLPTAPARGGWRMTSLDLAGGGIYEGRMGGPMTGFGALDSGTLCFAFKSGTVASR